MSRAADPASPGRGGPYAPGNSGLQHQERVLRREAPARERPQDIAAVHRQQRTELLTVRREDAAVVRGVGHEQHEDVHRTVPDLEGEAALQRLQIRESRLRLAARSSPAEAHETIPGTPVAAERQRDLGVPRGFRGQSGSEPFDELELRTIANRVAVWIEA